MNNENMRKEIQLFINKITEVYNNINLGYYYNENEEMYFIWHNNLELAANKEFNKLIGTLLKDLFYKNQIFNVCFTFDINKNVLLNYSEEIFNDELSIVFNTKNIDLLDQYNTMFNINSECKASTVLHIGDLIESRSNKESEYNFDDYSSECCPFTTYDERMIA